MSTLTVDTRELRVAGGFMLAAGALQPLWTWTGGVPCPLRAVTGIPCPLCGMTTSVCATMTGHLASAVAANPFGIVAVVVAMALLVGGRRLRVLRVPPWLLWAALAASWVWQIVRFA